MESNKIRVIFKEPLKEPKVMEIEDTIETFQKLVGGGFVEHIYLSDNVGCMLNDEGKLLNMPLNVYLADCKGRRYDVLMGNIIILQEESYDDLDMTDENIAKYLKQLQSQTLISEQVDLMDRVR